MSASDRSRQVQLLGSWLLTAVLLAACGSPEPAAGGPPLGPPPDVVLVRGPVEAVGPGMITVSTPEGARPVRVDERTGYGVLVPAGLASIGSGDFVGVTSQRRADGGLEAVEVHIFPESMRGAGEGHYPWDIPRPGGTTMTNAPVAAVVSEVDGPVLTLNLQGEDIPITVPASAPVVRIDLRGPADVLRPGYGVAAVTRKGPDGSLVALSVYTGESGAMPVL